jgi:hypothetical protein
VRRALINDELVLDAGRIESPAKGLDVGGDDIRVSASFTKWPVRFLMNSGVACMAHPKGVRA